MSNILKYQNPSSPLLKPWKALEKMNYEAIPDSTFTRDKTGIGSIEYFDADNNNGITYLNGYYKAHPKPGTDVILYDPATNDQQDVRLDALHFMPKDPIYGALYDEYLLATRDGDVAYNADRLLQEYIDSDKLEQAFKTYDVKDVSGLRERLFLNEADGLLRNMFIEGTPEYIKSKRYYPDKAQLEQWNAHLMPYINNIKTYLETGVKPEHVIEPAVVTAYKKGGRIHIKKKNRGKFTEYCGGKVTEECIAKGKKSKNPLTRRRANFASVVRKWKHENGGILKAQEGTNELYPAGIAIPSNETIDFFKDFAQRYKKFNGINKNQSISSLISKDKAIVLKRGLPTYNTENKQIFIPSDDVGVSTYSHELVHKLNDLVLERTNKERKLLNDAYPLSIAKHVYGRAPEDTRNELIEDERFSTNTELRRKISNDYGNVLGKKLNKVIRSLSTNDIINYVNNINGYVGESDFLKYPEHIIDGKTLFEHWKEDIGDVPEYYNMPWEELPKSKQDQWQYLYDSREGVAPNYMIFDEDKPKAIKKALIKVAQESKSNNIRSKNFINVSRQGGILKAQEGTGNGFWSKLWNAVKEGGMAARDAKLGAVGAQQVRDLYSEGKNQEAQDLAKQYAKANTTGIALAGGAASTGLLGDLMVTGATTAADTFIDGDTDNFGKNLSFNAAFDLAGHGAGKLLRNVDWSKVRNSVESIPDTKADVSEYINTVDDALPERQPLTTNKSKQFWDGTSESKLTDAEKAGVPKEERNQPINVRTSSQEFSNKYISSKMSLRKPTYDYEDLTENYFRDVSADEFNKRLKEYVSYARRKGSPIITNEIAEPIVKGYRNYLNHLDFDAKDLSDEELRIILSKHFADLSRNASGKMKDQIVWHSSPTWFDEFDYRYTGKNMENSGAMGPGNYFSKEATMYGRGKKGEFSGKYDMGNTQPYIITDVMSTPSGKDMQNKGLLPTIIHKYRGRDIYGQKWNPDPEFDIKLKAQIDAVPLNDNKMYVLEGTDSGFDKLYQTPFGLPGGELMIRRNTGIKSLYPHPSRFVRDADGFVHLTPVDWNDARVNFKKGGKL